MALMGAAGEVHGVELSANGLDAAGRTDAAIARTLLVRAGVTEEAIDARAEAVVRGTCTAYDVLCPADLSERVSPGMAEVLEALAGGPASSVSRW